jgi:hypothetical protein
MPWPPCPNATANASDADGTCGCSVVVVAKYKENTDWTRKLHAEVAIVDKSAGNIGREGLSYLQWVVGAYNQLDRWRCVCFSHGSFAGYQTSKMGRGPITLNNAQLPAGKDVAALHPLQTKLLHAPCGGSTRHPPWPCLPNIWAELGLTIDHPQQRFTTFASGFMIVRAAAIKFVPLRVYWRLIYSFFVPQPFGVCRPQHVETVGYALERSWRALFNCRRINCSFRPPPPRPRVLECATSSCAPAAALSPTACPCAGPALCRCPSLSIALPSAPPPVDDRLGNDSADVVCIETGRGAQAWSTEACPRWKMPVPIRRYERLLWTL